MVASWALAIGSADVLYNPYTSGYIHRLQAVTTMRRVLLTLSTLAAATPILKLATLPAICSLSSGSQESPAFLSHGMPCVVIFSDMA